MNGLELLLRNEAALVVLEAVRISGMVIVAPLGWTHAPNRVKAALVILLTLVAHGELGQIPVSEGPTEALAFLVATEFVLGLAIGLVPRLVIAAVEIAGEQIAPMMGLGVAQIFDPMAHGSQNVLTSILRVLAMLLGVLVGLHRAAQTTTRKQRSPHQIDARRRETKVSLHVRDTTAIAVTVAVLIVLGGIGGDVIAAIRDLPCAARRS